MKILFTDLFDIFKETDNSETPNLREERIYSFCQDIAKGFTKIPVFSGATKNSGVAGLVPKYFEDSDIKKEKVILSNNINYYINKEESITIVADGKAGSMFYRYTKDFPIFCMNISCLAIFKKNKEEVRKKYSKFDGLNLKWFYLKFKNLFENLVMGEGVKHFTKKIYDNIELEIPPIKEQEIEFKNYDKLNKVKNKLDNFNNKIKNIREKNLTLKEKFEEIDDTPVEKIFDSVSGNSGLTEEYIYSKTAIASDSKYKVLSSSTINRTYMGEVPKGKLHSGKDMKIFENKKGLLVIRNGKAGKLFHLNNGKYTLNDHAYILFLNKEFKDDIMLKWIIYQYQSLFFQFSSSSDNGTWNKTNFMKYGKIKIIPHNEQVRVISHYDKLEKLEGLLLNLKEKINNLFTKELVYE